MHYEKAALISANKPGVLPHFISHARRPSKQYEAAEQLPTHLLSTALQLRFNKLTLSFNLLIIKEKLDQSAFSESDAFCAREIYDFENITLKKKFFSTNQGRARSILNFLLNC